MGVVKNQTVDVKWNGNNRRYYEDEGVIYTKQGDTFKIHISKIKDGSSVNVEIICDQCGKRDIKNLKNIRNRDICFCSRECVDIYKIGTGTTSFKSKEHAVELAINELIKLSHTLDKCPTVYDFERICKDKKLISRRLLEKFLNSNYNDICYEHLGYANQLSKNKETMIRDLMLMKDELGCSTNGGRSKK